MTQFFFAITPPEPMRSQIEAFRARWGHPHHNVEPHATVKAPFPWDGDPEQLLTPVRSACAALAPFPARLGAPARFGGAGVLYLTVESPGLHQLHLAVLEALSGLLPPRDDAHEGEGYTPHLTLAVGRFGIGPEAMERMEQEARAELGALPPFAGRPAAVPPRKPGGALVPRLRRAARKSAIMIRNSTLKVGTIWQP